MEAYDVIVIGAGLAGLRASRVLAGSGCSVLVIDGADAVGGRQRTDEVDGFLLDRGFQVLNPAYPAVQRWVDLPALRMRSFPVGVRVRREDRIVELRHPLRHPLSVPRTIACGLVSPRDALALARWVAPALVHPRRMIAGADRPLREGWDAAGLRGRLRAEVLEPFLAGVLADDSGDSSDVFARLLVRMFVLGAPGVPEHGIAALPAQLARGARAEGAMIRLGARATRVRRARGGVEVDIAGADPLRADAVVVAVGPESVTDLVDVPRPATKGLQTWWFAADGAPPGSALLTVDGRRSGPIVNTVVMSDTAASYAPPGAHLVQATCLLPGDRRDAASEAQVRRQLGEMWDASATGWRLIRRDDIVHALPVQPPPLRVTAPSRLAEGIYLAGDHRDTASIQGALVSGQRAAVAVLTDTGRSSTTRPQETP